MNRTFDPALRISRCIELGTLAIFEQKLAADDEIVILTRPNGCEQSGQAKRRTKIRAVVQPRLDWQMWFAALGNVDGNPWFINFCIRLLQGKPEVLGLVEKNPFPNKPPKFVRAVVYEYHFTDIAERRRTGNWWRREFKGEYMPVISVREGN